MAILTNLAPVEENITFYNGQTWKESWVATDDNGDPIDLSSATVTIQVREKQSTSSALVFEADNDAVGGITISGADNNTIDLLAIVDGDLGTWFWDLRITLSPTESYVRRAGTFENQANVTPAP